jgi:hypothetical protein
LLVSSFLAPIIILLYVYIEAYSMFTFQFLVTGSDDLQRCGMRVSIIL